MKMKCLEDNDYSQQDVGKAAVQLFKLKFWWFAVIASLNHALTYVVVSYATSLVGQSLGGVILGLSWSLNAVSGLFFATAAERTWGFKNSMILSLWGYAIQITTLYLAMTADDVDWKWFIAIFGSTISGITSAIWWTSQGIFFNWVCKAVFEASKHSGSPEDMNDIRADLSAQWTIIYQGADIVVFLSLTIFPALDWCSISTVVLILSVLGVITALLGMTFEDINHQHHTLSVHEIIDAVVAVPQQFRDDSRATLIMPFNFGFGISTAIFAYYINYDGISSSASLGTVSLGVLEALSYFVAILSAYPYSLVSKHIVHGDHWVLQFGSLAFLSCGLIVLFASESQLETWTVVILAKILYGLGRGVFEGVCRGVYSSLFQGNSLSTAYSGQTLATGFSGGLCFFLFAYMAKWGIGLTGVVNGCIALVAFSFLMKFEDPTIPKSWKAFLGQVLYNQVDYPSSSERQHLMQEESNFPM
jgi:hypothetical protein